MAQAPMDSPVIYEPKNGELRTVPEYFRKKGKGVTAVTLEQGVCEGAWVVPGNILAYISWVTGPAEPLVAPGDCEGKINWINPQFDHHALAESPQTLLCLEHR